MVTKTVQQNVDAQGKPTQRADSRPGWFIKDNVDINIDNPVGVMPPSGLPAWGPVFSEAQRGNGVEFFTTGADYFEKVAAAISGAKKSVFIAGWQINYDVKLVGDRTLFDCLQDAMKGGATVYVMPWLAPPGPIDTGYLMTMLAIHHLNAGTKGARAYCMPAMVQSDQGALNVMFSHHQKQVVIDNHKAFVGGIDLAYGRRDDARFSLKHGGRKLNEFYSPCVPPIRKLRNVDIQHCVTSAELIAAGLTRGMLQSGATFLTSPSEGKLAEARDAVGEFTEYASEASAWAAEKLDDNLFKDFTTKTESVVLDGAQDLSKWAWGALGPSIRGRIEQLVDSGSANATNVGAVLVAWLSGGDMQRLPPSMLREVDKAIQAIVYGLMAGLNARINAMPERYEPLFKKITAVPGGASERDAAVQPRMPWQDIQCCVQGPSVFDLSQNFVQRWNGTAKAFETSYADYRNNVWASKLLSSAGISVPASPKAVRIAAAHLPQRAAAGPGKNTVQVLRSASLRLQRDEAAAMGPGAKPPARVQNNCLKAMLQAIHSSQQFLYIEGQFFQTCHTPGGSDASGKWSGPQYALLDLWSLPGYAKFAERLKISGVSVAEIVTKIRWSELNKIVKEAGGDEFKSDLFAIIRNWATIEAMRRLGTPQDNLKNPIGKALVNRIERAIDGGAPFHVYLVLPVHPEGTLNTINIMTQMHHTMQSLVHGNHSLVNGVRRAILVRRYCKDHKWTKAQAKAEVARMRLGDMIDAVGDAWKDHLTLLNLRTWDIIGKRAVTEQIYVHSKLLIADDRVAILGSANINDRSQLGDRDSELAVIVIDEARHPAKLDGVHAVPVGKSVQKLRRDLWKKLFGLTGGIRPANSLASDAILDSPAAPATWKAIQLRAQRNARAYDAAFRFIPRNAAHPGVQSEVDKKGNAYPGSIWPTWRYAAPAGDARGGKLAYRMPFDELFWRASKHSDVVGTWNVAEDQRGLAPESAPVGIEGFIVALPTHWLAHEDNDSGMNLTVLAANDKPGDEAQTLASNAAEPQDEGQPA